MENLNHALESLGHVEEVKFLVYLHNNVIMSYLQIEFCDNSVYGSSKCNAKTTTPKPKQVGWIEGFWRFLGF